MKQKQMTQFNIKDIMTKYKLDADTTAKILFPSVKYPKQAFDRILKGEASPSVEQLENLATHLGVLVADLFMIDSWSGKVKNGYFTFTKDNFEVIVGYEGSFITFFKDGEVVKQVVAANPGMPLSDFIDYLNTNIETL